MALMAHPKYVSARNGKVVFSSDIARQYGLKDIDGRILSLHTLPSSSPLIEGKRPANFRSLKLALRFMKYEKLAKCVPESLNVPATALALAGQKF